MLSMAAEKHSPRITNHDDSLPPAKRRRTSGHTDDLVTPPLELPISSTSAKSSTTSLLDRAVHILTTEATALRDIALLYETSEVARKGLAEAVSAISDAHDAGGKLVICGVGKSAYIGMKFAATCKSLGVPASFMHAAEAAHGDLGDIRKNDVVLFISYSGSTPELLNLLPHLLPTVRVMAMTSHLQVDDCPLLRTKADGILLPAPIPEKEEVALGVAAPTVSTTVALAVSDMLALSLAEQLNDEHPRQVFKRNHPGGTIGLTHQQVEQLDKDGVDFSVLELPSPSISGSDTG